MKKTPKSKACKMCKQDFDQYQSTQVVCSPVCALELTKEKAARTRKSVTRQMRADFNAKDRSYQLKKAQEVFNAFIRERDKDSPCISCGTTDQSLRYDAGHYRTTGAHPELRYDEDNCHKQCHYNCNIMRSGNIVDYRINLSRLIGSDRLEKLEGSHPPKNYTLDDIIEIKLKYRAKLKQLKQARAA